MTARDPDSSAVRETPGELERVSGATFGGRDQTPEHLPDTDKIERWGRFIGRALGLIFLVLLIANLVTHWFY